MLLRRQGRDGGSPEDSRTPLPQYAADDSADKGRLSLKHKECRRTRSQDNPSDTRGRRPSGSSRQKACCAPQEEGLQSTALSAPKPPERAAHRPYRRSRAVIGRFKVYGCKILHLFVLLIFVPHTSTPQNYSFSLKQQIFGEGFFFVFLKSTGDVFEIKNQHYKNIKKGRSFPKKCYCKSVSTVLSPLIHHKMCIFAHEYNILK